MAEYRSVEEALKNAADATALRIDFSKGATLTNDVGKLHALTQLCLDSCPKNFVFPKSLRDLPKLTKLELIDYEDDSPAAITELANALPDLLEIELQGKKKKPSTMPADVARFTKLARLRMHSTGFSTFSAEFAHLANLKTLELYEDLLHAIPKEVCDLPNLHQLVLGRHVNGLPAEITKLKSLRELDLSNALNKGASLGSDWDDDQIPKLKPLPKVLSQLTWLTDLDLSTCGVWQIDGLKPLVNLVSLNLSWAGIENCNALAGMTDLETLTVTSDQKLRDFSALASLTKLRKLKMSSTGPTSLEFLTKLPALRELDISSVKSRDFSPIYTLNDLTELEADEEIQTRWEKRAELVGLPDIGDVKKKLKSADVATVEAALRDLVRIIDAMSSDDTNGLMTVFGDEDESDETKILKRVPLDSALKKHKDALSIETLTAVFGAALRKLGDNFNAALIAVAEIVKRENAVAQEAVVQSFIKAAEYYDSGHRSDANTVHDQLIEKYFPKFETAPLATLLAWCSNDHLSSESGDRMDALFLPAFKRAKDEATLSLLIETLGTYTKEETDYGRGESAVALLKKAEKVAPKKFADAFATFHEQQAAVIASAKRRAKIQSDLKSRVAKRVENAIAQIPTLTADDYESLYTTYWDAPKTEGVSWKARHDLLDTFFAHDDARGAADVLTSLGQEDAKRLRAEIEATQVAKEKIVKALRQTLDVALAISHLKEIDQNFLEIVRAWVFELDGISPESSKGQEAAQLMMWGARNYIPTVFAAGLSMLEKLSGNADFTVSDKNYGGTIGTSIAGYVGSAVKSQKDLMLRFARVLHKLTLENKTRERMLAQLVGLSIVEGDDEAYAALAKLLPNEISNDVLAFNLACGAARNKDRHGLLKYTKRSLELGKSPTQFRSDADFAQFLEDPELAAILDSAL